jgi:TetR/AcrR family transcriptional repressor of nem operon
MSKKQEIISIAREVIHSKGYQATSISDILHAATIRKDNSIIIFPLNMILG